MSPAAPKDWQVYWPAGEYDHRWLDAAEGEVGLPPAGVWTCAQASAAAPPVPTMWVATIDVDRYAQLFRVGRDALPNRVALTALLRLTSIFSVPDHLDVQSVRRRIFDNYIVSVATDHAAWKAGSWRVDGVERKALCVRLDQAVAGYLIDASTAIVVTANYLPNFVEIQRQRSKLATRLTSRLADRERRRTLGRHGAANFPDSFLLEMPRALLA
jgi:hypothetical protein